jgi:hypothetical protein
MGKVSTQHVRYHRHPDSVCHQWSMLEWEYVIYHAKVAQRSPAKNCVLKNSDHIVL